MEMMMVKKVIMMINDDDDDGDHDGGDIGVTQQHLKNANNSAKAQRCRGTNLFPIPQLQG